MADKVLQDDTQAALKDLPAKRRAFVLAYADHSSPTFRNATKSWEAAGYSPGGARQSSSKALTSTATRRAVLMLERDTAEARAQVNLIDSVWMHRHLSALADFTVLDIADEAELANGRFKLDIAKLRERPELAAVIDGVKQGPLGELDVKLMGRKSILELAGKHREVSAFVDRHEHSGPGGTPLTVRAAPPDTSNLSDEEQSELRRMARKSLLNQGQGEIAEQAAEQ